jgi:saccharopepsin
MVNQKLLESPVFSFRVGSSEEDGGEAVFGGIDHGHYTGKIHYVPIRRKGYWEVELEKITFGDDELELENTGAAIDTGKSCSLDADQYVTSSHSLPRYFSDRHPN